jgi:hypothetical protein
MLAFAAKIFEMVRRRVGETTAATRTGKFNEVVYLLRKAEYQKLLASYCSVTLD